MSADNGYILRYRESDKKFVLQMYFASSDSYPDINDPKAMTFDTFAQAMFKYDEMEEEDHYLSEYGLCISIKKEQVIKSKDGILVPVLEYKEEDATLGY